MYSKILYEYFRCGPSATVPGLGGNGGGAQHPLSSALSRSHDLQESISKLKSMIANAESGRVDGKFKNIIFALSFIMFLIPVSVMQKMGGGQLR